MKELLNIKRAVEVHFRIKDIGIKYRGRDIVDARVVYMFLATELTPYSYVKIASLINRDHSTVTHAINNIYNQWRSQPYFFKDQLNAIKEIYRELADTDELKHIYDAEILLQKYKAKVKLQDMQMQHLFELIEKKDKLIKELEKNQLVWL